MGHEIGRCQQRIIRPIGLSVLCAFRAPVSSDSPLGLFLLGLELMTKLPYIALYVNDWGRDLEEHPLEIEGAWLRIVCKLWWEGGSGKAIKPIEAWSKILRVSEEKTLEICKYIKDKSIGNIDIFNNGDGKPMAKIICRRMEKDWKLRGERRRAGQKGADARWQVGGKKKKMAKHMAKVWQSSDNDNDNDNTITTKKNNSNIITDVIEYLNLKTNKNYRSNNPKTRELIQIRIKINKATLDDFKKVIDIKTAEWRETDNDKYLRPETLFGTKFESYLNQKSRPTLEEAGEAWIKHMEEKEAREKEGKDDNEKKF